MAIKPVNYHISKDDQGRNYAYAGKPGLGTLALLAPVQIDDWSVGSEPANPEDITVLYGVRSTRGPNIATNTISAAHHQSTGGFMINYPGLRDGGTFDFEANFNPGKEGKGIPWQDPEQPDNAGAVAKSIMESPLFLHEEWGHAGLPMMQMIVAPASMNHLWYMRGFLAMLGPATYEMEDIVKATMSFKISGRPYLATPESSTRVGPFIERSIVNPANKESAERRFTWYADQAAEAGSGQESYPAYWLETTS